MTREPRMPPARTNEDRQPARLTRECDGMSRSTPPAIMNPNQNAEESRNRNRFRYLRRRPPRDRRRRAGSPGCDRLPERLCHLPRRGNGQLRRHVDGFLHAALRAIGQVLVTASSSARLRRRGIFSQPRGRRAGRGRAYPSPRPGKLQRVVSLTTFLGRNPVGA
jgi:hypothetical protein